MISWFGGDGELYICRGSTDLLSARDKGPAFSDRTPEHVTSPILKDFVRVSHFGECEHFFLFFFIFFIELFDIY